MRVIIDGKEYRVENDVCIIHENPVEDGFNLHITHRKDGLTYDKVDPKDMSSDPIEESACIPTDEFYYNAFGDPNVSIQSQHRVLHDNY